MEYMQSWEDRVPLGVHLDETEQAALKVMTKIMDMPVSVLYDGIQYAALAHRYKELMHGADEQVFRGDGQRIGEKAQVERLAAFIMEHVPGEPRRGDEGAGDCAVRIIKELQGTIRELQGTIRELTLRSNMLAEVDEEKMGPPL